VPVKDEEARFRLLTNNLAKDVAVLKDTATDDDIEDSEAAKRARVSLENLDDS